MDVFIRSLEDDVCAYPSRPLSVLYLHLQSYGWWSRPLSNNHPNHPSLPPDRTSWSSREHNGNSLQPLIAWAWKLHHYVKMGIVLLFLLFRPKIYRLMVKADITESWWIWGKTDGKRSSEKIPVMSSGCIWFRPLSSTGSSDSVWTSILKRGSKIKDLTTTWITCRGGLMWPCDNWRVNA